jgi:DNA-binding XRE family transcriptional regulator
MVLYIALSSEIKELRKKLSAIVSYVALYIVYNINKLYFCTKKSCTMHFEGLIKTIKERRDSLHVTQETLAELSDVGLRTLKQFESGKGNPTLQTLQKLADVLGLEVSLLLKNKLITNEKGKDTIQG